MELAADELRNIELLPKLVIDAEVPLSILGNIFNLIQKLSPFGRGNSTPTFLTRGLEVLEYRNLGNEGKHLQLKLKQDNAIWKAIAFNAGKHGSTGETSLRGESEAISLPPYIDAVYNVEKTWWNGEEVLRLNLLDFAPSA